MTLIQRFVDRELSAESFERSYFALFKSDTRTMPDAEFAILDTLFGDVDAFCAEPELRDERDLDDLQLLDRARHALQMLSELKDHESVN